MKQPDRVILVDPLYCCTLCRAEKVAEITSWLKSHPVSSVSRTSCKLQVLDAAIVERIEEAVDKIKVNEAQAFTTLQQILDALCCLNSLCSVFILFLHLSGEEEHQESPRDSQASSSLQSEYQCVSRVDNTSECRDVKRSKLDCMSYSFSIF